MEREKVKKILLYCRNVDGIIKYNAKTIQDYEDRYYSMGGGTFGGMPKSKYKTSSPTEMVALNVPNFVSIEIRELQEKNERLIKLKTSILHELNNLTLLQKRILNEFYIKGLKWVQISAQVHYSVTQCKKIRNRGLDNLARQFVKDEFIKNFNYPN